MDRAQILAMKEDIPATIAELEKANALTNEFDTEVVFLLANCHMTAGNYEKLLEYSRQIIEKSESPFYQLTARYYVPMALKMLNRMDEARPLYDEAITEFRNQALASPGNLDAYMLRVMCLRDLEQFDKALELIDYVVTLQPNSVEARMLRVTLLESLGRNDEAQEETKTVNTMLPEEMRRK
jgi:tetratricopeptide (TPR) repeat protein